MKLDDKIKELEDSKELLVKQVVDNMDQVVNNENKDNIKDIINDARMVNYALKEIRDIDFIPEEHANFSIDDYLMSNQESSSGETLYSIQTNIIKIVENIKNHKQATKIVTNTKLGYLIHNINNKIMKPDIMKIQDTKEPFLIGDFNGIDIFVDAYMQFNDNRIIFYNNEKEVHVLNIKDTHHMLT